MIDSSDMSISAIDKHAIAQGAITAAFTALLVGLVNFGIDEAKRALAARRAAADKIAKDKA